MRRLFVSTVLWLACAPIYAGERPAQEKKLDLLGDPLPPGAAARLGTARLRHIGPITATAWAPNGKLIASGGGDEFIRLWDAATGKEVRQMKGVSSFTALVFFSDGKTLVSADAQGNIQLWDVESGREIRRFSSSKDRVTCLALSPDNRTLYSAGWDRTVRQWLVAGGIELRTFPQHEGHLLALAVTADGKELRTACTPNVKQSHPQGDTAGLAQVFDTAKGVETRRFTIRSTPDPNRQRRLATFSKGGRLLASAGFDGGLSLYEADTGKLVRSVGADAGRVSFGPRHLAADFSPCGRFIAARDVSGGVRLFGAATGQELRFFKYPFGIFGGWTSGPDGVMASTFPHCVAFAPDGQTLAVSAGHGLRLWNVSDEREALPLPGPHSPVESLCFSRDGTLVFTVSKDSAIHVWDRASGKEIASAWSSVIEVVAGAGPRNFFALSVGTSTEWSLIDGKLINKAQRWGPAGVFYNVMTASASSDAKVAIVTRDSKPGSETGITILDGPSGKIVTKLDHAKGTVRGSIAFLAFSPDGKLLAACCSPAPIQVWDLATGRLMREFAKGGAPSAGKFAFSPDGKLLAVGDQDIKLYEIATGHERLQIGPTTGLQALVFSPDGRYLIAGLKKGGVQFFDVSTGGSAGEFGEVRAFAISPHDGTLACACADTSVLLFTKLPWREPRPVVRLRLEPNELDLLWQILVQADARRAHQAIWALAGAPEHSVPFLKDKVKPVEAGKFKPVEHFIRDLDSANFQIRQKATRELELLGDQAETALGAALTGNLSLESRRRVEELLARIKDLPSPERLQILRALEVLEHAGTDEARRVLAALAQGRAGHWLTELARQALERQRRGQAIP